ncbi:MAG: DUF899 domain-containing protein [Gemmatimonadetes bacterium]|nr:MAG: DUF899 domain-containing protein [Gemmatimonadota bacterium]
MTPEDSSKHAVVSHEQWIAARTKLLAKEKELTRARDELSRLRRALPWERVEKPYVFEGPDGKETLAQLFAGKSQLFVYHFMFGPDDQEGCPSCSFWADHYDAAGLHLPHRDVGFVVVSRAPFANIEPFKRRMGWRFKWVSSAGTDFNFDLGVSFTPDQVKRGTKLYNYQTTNPGMPDREGASVFYKDRSGAVFHTYSCYARGIEMLNGTYHVLDLVPKGRDEDPDDVQSWVRHHDRYED